MARFAKLSPYEREIAEYLLEGWLTYERHAHTRPGTRAFYHLCGAAARFARHGPPPGYNARLAYRRARLQREWKAAYPGVPYPARVRGPYTPLRDRGQVDARYNGHGPFR